MTYDDLCLPPVVESTIDSRNSCDTSVMFCGVKLDVPIIASPMPDICNGLMAGTLAKVGAMGIIHRFQTIEEQAKEFELGREIWRDSTSPWDRSQPIPIACAIGIKGDFVDRIRVLRNVGCEIFCFDTANGFNSNIKKALKAIEGWPIKIIAGNVATMEGFRYLAETGIQAIRVGIAGGSVCETKTETGVYYPMPVSIAECSYYKKNNILMSTPPKASLIAAALVADGGIKEPRHMNIALALGADVVMCGKIFAGYEETPGKPFGRGIMKSKLYRGSSSYSVQNENTGEKPEYTEGDETMVPYINQSVAKIIKRYKRGLQSSMSYHNSLTLDEFRRNVKIRYLNGNDFRRNQP